MAPSIRMAWTTADLSNYAVGLAMSVLFPYRLVQAHSTQELAGPINNTRLLLKMSGFLLP
eukprot:1136317-Pelagomonas_calceolata.AAC.1